MRPWPKNAPLAHANPPPPLKWGATMMPQRPQRKGRGGSKQVPPPPMSLAPLGAKSSPNSSPCTGILTWGNGSWGGGALPSCYLLTYPPASDGIGDGANLSPPSEGKLWRKTVPECWWDAKAGKGEKQKGGGRMDGPREEAFGVHSGGTTQQCGGLRDPTRTSVFESRGINGAGLRAGV